MDQAPGGSSPGTVAPRGEDVAAAPTPVELLRDLAALGFDDVQEIASGGFATVYRAQQPAMGRAVAVKVVSAPVTDPLVRSRFQRECQALGLLSDHPAIVTVFDAGFTASGRPYLVMELMTGGSLAEQLQAHGPRPWADVLDIGVHIAGALHSAHHQGVLHRDVKPANILISEYGAPKLGDFGIARLQGTEHTRTGSLTGSVAHAAPELLGGDGPSVRSDVYALGSTLFTLLRGQTAFLHATDESIIPALARITMATIPDLRTEGVPGPVCDVVEQLMAKRADERPASAMAAGQALQRVQRELGVPVTALAVPDGEAVETVQEPPPAQPARTVHARVPRRLAMVLAALGVVAILGAVLASERASDTGGTATQPRSPEAGGTPLDVSTVAEQITQIRGLPVDGSLRAVALQGAEFEQRLRAWSTAGRQTELAVEQRVLEALHLVPPGTDLVALTQDLYAEQFLGFYDGERITVRADTSSLSPLRRSIVADETAGAMIDRHYVVTPRSERIADVDARRAWVSLARGDTAVTASAWTERFLTADEQQQRATELSAQPDRVARGLPDAVRAELVFPYVAGEAFVRTIFETGGVAAIDDAYAAPPATTEQLLHPTKYDSREPAKPVSLPDVAPPGWSPLVTQTFGEYDVQRLTAGLSSRRSAAAAAGWGGGVLSAWQRGDDTAVRIALVFDTADDGRQACAAIRAAHLRRSGATPSDGLLLTAGDALGLRCAGPTVDLAVAPDRDTTVSLLDG